MFEGLRRVMQRTRQFGPWMMAQRVFARLEEAGWENYFGVPTARVEYDEGVYSSDSIHYEPLPWPLARRLMRVLPPERDEVFLDYGSGLGRLLLMAASRRVRRVVGVELIESLAEHARKNVAKARHVNSPVEVLVADASSFQVPDDVTTIALFNPFIGDTMTQAQARIRESLERRPRPLRLAYAHANDQPNLFEHCDWLQLEQHLDGGAYEQMNLQVYRH